MQTGSQNEDVLHREEKETYGPLPVVQGLGYGGKRYINSSGREMAICRLMIEDFMYHTGRFPDCFNRKMAYSDQNLEEGIEYANWLIEDGYKTEPFFGFNLKKFILWAKEILGQ